MVLVVVAAVVGGDFFVGPLNDLVAQNHNSNINGTLKIEHPLQIGHFL